MKPELVGLADQAFSLSAGCTTQELDIATFLCAHVPSSPTVLRSVSVQVRQRRCFFSSRGTQAAMVGSLEVV